MAFDATYLTCTLSQLELHGTRGIVGGMWFPDSMENSFISLEADGKEEIDMSEVLKSSTMLECVVWDPNVRRKLPLPVCSLPVQHNFAGTGATYRGCMYILKTIGKVLAAANGTVKGVTFDSHGSHMWVRRCLHGQFRGINKADLADVEFFGKLRYENLPEHGLPRLPIRVAKHEDQVVWGLCGICSLLAPAKSS